MTDPAASTCPGEPLPDLAQVRGQEGAKRAVEIAAAGGHSLLLMGPAGSGKTLLARCLPGVLPPLTEAEVIQHRAMAGWWARRPPAGEGVRAGRDAAGSPGGRHHA